MNESTSIIEGLTAGLQAIVAEVLTYLPKVAAAVLVLVLGWLLARLLRLLVVRAIGSLDQLWQRLISKRGLGHIQPRHPPTRIVGELVFWLLMLIFVTLATEILGLSIFGTWLKEIITYLPLAAAGLLIVLVGFVVSSLVRDLVASAAASAELSQGDLLARTAQVIILFTAIILGIDQIGIDIMFLSVVLGIILASMLGGIALAFGLGARTHVSNIIAANQLRQIYQVGDKVRIGDVEGLVTDIRVSRVIIETEAGTVDIPAKLFDEQVTYITEKGA
ncbi:mechanosensitive ion channel family protein [Sulfuriflexus mobilis]|uniref:mechanosensitive ion channel family protein n=1 Tax=Sulfuriflexus mobilis TaxID=1811807 RepID=UPI000F82B6B6|nr:mechanosensitive ion channel domain-containing protein [Sulfuriflexus mobilis]